MRKLSIAMTCLAFAAAVPAQEALQCANPDVLNALVFNARADSKLTVSRAMPANAAGFGAPADFHLIGSGMRAQNRSTVVAWKTTLETGKAFDSLLGFLSEQGWRREAAQPAIATVAGPQQPNSAGLCRNGERRNLLVQELGGVRYATISAFEAASPRACDAPLPQQTFNPMATINALQAAMPQFSLPETARMSGRPDPRLGGGNGSSYSTSMRIESPDTAASLALHLARQLTEQGWRGDAEWNGALSTGSTWTRKAADGKPYWGTLEIVGAGGSVYDLGFRITARPR